MAKGSRRRRNPDGVESTPIGPSWPHLSGRGAAEDVRLAEANAGKARWRRWGPYVSERQWGTVREDYSPFGTAWDSFPHDHARSRAYRWGEDGLLGISDNHGRLCFQWRSGTNTIPS